MKLTYMVVAVKKLEPEIHQKFSKHIRAKQSKR